MLLTKKMKTSYMSFILPENKIQSKQISMATSCDNSIHKTHSVVYYKSEEQCIETFDCGASIAFIAARASLSICATRCSVSAGLS